MRNSLFFLLLSFLAPIVSINAQTKVSGTIKDNNGQPLPYASVTVKGSAIGTTANNKGDYLLTVSNGEHTLACRQVGYKTVEQKLTAKGGEVTMDFTLTEQKYELKEVVVGGKGEDPAYEIIRNAIKKRKTYLNELKKFQCEVYIKGQLQLRNYPKNFMGEKVDFEDGDTTKKKMIFLSESLANYFVDGKKKKLEVVSTKVSGESDGFGFSNPQIISFYEENITIGLNPRGFVSPISDNALNFYKYKLRGTFFENGRMVNHIQVIPKRKYEPLFSGYINIIEDEWRLQSVQLTLLKEQQMQLLDTLKIDQIYVPYKKSWVIKQQVIYPSGKFLLFDFFGNFIQVYDKFNTEPTFAKKFFNNTIIEFKDSSNKKPLAYWDTIRPVPLLPEEIKDYKKKDSLEQARKDPKYLDSLDRKSNKVTFGKLFLFGQSFENRYKKTSISISPLISLLSSINTVEGYVLSFSGSYNKVYKGRKSLSITPYIRYGTSNYHYQAQLSGRYTFGKKYRNEFYASGGQNVFQFNNNNPIAPNINTISTVYYTRNYMKLYQAAFAKIGYEKALGDGVIFNIEGEYQDRSPLENTYLKVWRQVDNRQYTPNYPVDVFTSNIVKHQALSATASIKYSPGTKYIEFPDRKESVGSKYPTFSLSLTQGINSLFGSDVDYTKWHGGVNGGINMKLLGRIRYKVEVGGFLNTNKVFAPDYTHYLGNQTAFASQYMEGFQLLPYYKMSNTSNFYTEGHLEYHLNGLLSNKVPGFRELNWFFVVGGNALLIQPNQQYYEAFFSIENIFKVIRLDAVQAFSQSGKGIAGIRFSMPLVAATTRRRDR
jgi:hypothetical protein